MGEMRGGALFPRRTRTKSRKPWVSKGAVTELAGVCVKEDELELVSTNRYYSVYSSIGSIYEILH